MDSSVFSWKSLKEYPKRTVLLMLVLSCALNQAAKHEQSIGKVRCEVTAVHLGGEGQLTCHYPVDLNDVSSVVNVGVKQFGGQPDTHILDCLWDEIYQCTDVRKGCDITQAAGNSMTITITNVTEEHKGRYRCVLIDATGIYDSEDCNSTVEEEPVPHSSTLETTPDNTDTEHSDYDEDFLFGIIVILAIGASLIVLGVLLVRRRRGRARHEKRHKYDDRYMENGDAATRDETKAVATNVKENDDGRPGTAAAAAAGDRADIPERPELSTDPLLPDQPEGDKERAEGKEDETIEILADPGSPEDVLQPESPHTPDTNKKAKEEEDKKEEKKEEEEEEEKEEDKTEEEEEEEGEKSKLLGSSEHSATPGAGPRSDAGYAQKPESSAPGPPRQGHAGQRLWDTPRHPGQAHHAPPNTQERDVGGYSTNQNRDIGRYSTNQNRDVGGYSNSKNREIGGCLNIQNGYGINGYQSYKGTDMSTHLVI